MKLAYCGVKEPGKIIVCGHWHTSYGNVRKEMDDFDLNGYKYSAEEFDKSHLERFKPYESDGIIALDACTAFTGFCNCMKLVTDESGAVISMEY